MCYNYAHLIQDISSLYLLKLGWLSTPLTQSDCNLIARFSFLQNSINLTPLTLEKLKQYVIKRNNCFILSRKRHKHYRFNTKPTHTLQDTQEIFQQFWFNQEDFFYFYMISAFKQYFLISI